MDQPTVIAIAGIAGTALASLGGIWLGHWLGHRASRDERLRQLELSAVADTREWLLDIVDTFGLAVNRKWVRVWIRGTRSELKRYPHNMPQLIVDPELLKELTTTLPEGYEAFPRVSRALADRLNAIRWVIQKAMMEQEREIAKTGRPRLATPDQEQMLIESAERIQRRTEELRRMSNLRILLRTYLPRPRAA
jgi:hypothetical protein